MNDNKSENLKAIKRFADNQQVFVQEDGLLGRENLLETINDLIENVNFLVENRDKYVSKKSLGKLHQDLVAIKAKFKPNSSKGVLSDEKI